MSIIQKKILYVNGDGLFRVSSPLPKEILELRDTPKVWKTTPPKPAATHYAVRYRAKGSRSSSAVTPRWALFLFCWRSRFSCSMIEQCCPYATDACRGRNAPVCQRLLPCDGCSAAAAVVGLSMICYTQGVKTRFLYLARKARGSSQPRGRIGKRLYFLL